MAHKFDDKNNFGLSWAFTLTESLWVMPSVAPSLSPGTTLTSTGCQPLATRTWMPIWQNRPDSTPQSSTCSALSMRSTLTSASTVRRLVIFAHTHTHTHLTWAKLFGYSLRPPLCLLFINASLPDIRRAVCVSAVKCSTLLYTCIRGRISQTVEEDLINVLERTFCRK